MPAAIGLSCPDWRRVWDDPIPNGTIRRQPQDFQVWEILDFEFSADGEHDFLLIEKVGANTAWVARLLASHATVAERDVGYAGMKDRHAVTSQWFSVRRPSGPKADWRAFAAPGVKVVRCERHHRKLRRGAHKGNSFDITVRDAGPLNAVQKAHLDKLESTGVPNYFGEQRFGRSGANLRLASDLFAGRRLSRAKRGLALSTARAFLFNHVLDRRVADGSWNRLSTGDCANLQGSGSVFKVPLVDDVLRRRCLEQDIHPSGPLWGKGELASGEAVAALEGSVADQFPALRDGLRGHVEQSRRALRLVLQNFEWQCFDDVLHLKFDLTRGGFATAVLREIVNYQDKSYLFNNT